jgi:hypothetical protein
MAGTTITMSEAKELRRRWAEKGSPPCEHPQPHARETHDLGADTGDDCCLTCGAVWWRQG